MGDCDVCKPIRIVVPHKDLKQKYKQRKANVVWMRLRINFQT